MIDTTRAMRIVGSNSQHRNGPVRFIADDDGRIIVRAASNELMEFSSTTGAGLGLRSNIRLENAPIRETLRFYGRRSASDSRVIKLQQTRPNASLGEIEVDVEGDKIVAVRLAS